MYIILTIIHVLISVTLVLIILAQSSKGGALDGLVGGTASSMLGSHGASEFLSKWTKIIGAVWIISSVVLAMNVRSMTAPSRARALEKLRSESQTEQPQELDVFDGTEVIETGEPESQPVPAQETE